MQDQHELTNPEYIWFGKDEEKILANILQHPISNSEYQGPSKQIESVKKKPLGGLARY